MNWKKSLHDTLEAPFLQRFVSKNSLYAHFTDDQRSRNNILSLLSKKDFGSFRQSVKKEHIFTQFPEEKNLLHYTVASGDAESVQHVLSLGAEVNCATARGYTPLIIAVLHRSEWTYTAVTQNK